MQSFFLSGSLENSIQNEAIKNYRVREISFSQILISVDME